jgi:two-component SAPR family response regulator
MEESTLPNFIIIDNDELTIVICNMLIKKLVPVAATMAFSKPVEALDFIKTNYSGETNIETIVLLDITMPFLNGWQVLDELMNFDKKILSHLKIFIFTSSVTLADKERAEKHPLVEGYIVKPLTKKYLQINFL